MQVRIKNRGEKWTRMNHFIEFDQNSSQSEWSVLALKITAAQSSKINGGAQILWVFAALDNKRIDYFEAEMRRRRNYEYLSLE